MSTTQSPKLNVTEQRTLCELARQLEDFPEGLVFLPEGLDPLGSLIAIGLVHRGPSIKGTSMTPVEITPAGVALAAELQPTYSADLVGLFVPNEPGRVTGIVFTMRVECDNGNIEYVTRLAGRDGGMCMSHMVPTRDDGGQEPGPDQETAP